MVQEKIRKEMTPEQVQELDNLLARACVAQRVVETYDQDRADRLYRAMAWAMANTTTFHRLVKTGIGESGLGDYTPRVDEHMKICGVLRDVLR